MNKNPICFICKNSVHDEWHILPDKFISDFDLEKARMEDKRQWGYLKINEKN